MRSIDWQNNEIVILDQTRLPDEERFLRLREVDQLAEAITSLRVRGAPALGVAGGLGLALAVRRARERGADPAAAVEQAARVLQRTRPTASNLRWGIERVRAAVTKGPDAVVASAVALLEADVMTNRAIANRGVALLEDLRQAMRRPLRLLTHCNTGALACVDWGTALGVIRAGHERGVIEEVFVDETRPLLQGSRLTTWELDRLGVPYRVIVDAAGPFLIAQGKVDAVVVGADRIARNGDVANKVGTYPLALAAHRAAIPFFVVAPESTVDLTMSTGADIPIEERTENEVLEFRHQRVAPTGSRALNPAFDVTPAELVTAIVTEQRIVRPAEERLHAIAG